MIEEAPDEENDRLLEELILRTEQMERRLDEIEEDVGKCERKASDHTMASSAG